MNIGFMSNSISVEKGPQRRFGYSVVATKVVEYLQKQGHQMFMLGMQDITTPYKLPNGVINLGIRYDAFMGDICEDYIRAYKIDCFATMLDLWLPQTDYIIPMCQKQKIPWVAHVTLNSSPLTPFIGNKVRMADYIVAPSQYNHRLLADAGLANITSYIPHGFDDKIFHPNPDFNEEMRKTLKIEDKKFIACVVNRNKGVQKRICDAMRAWTIVCNNNPQFKKDAVLLLVHDPVEPDGFRTDMFRDRLGMNENMKYIWNKPNPDGVDMVATYEGDPEGMRHNANIALPPTEISKIYNLSDISIVPSQNESFCLPALESLACGTTVIMGDHSVGPEHIKQPQTGITVKIAYGEVTALLSEVMNADLGDFASAIQTMYSDQDFRHKCGVNGIKYAETLTWDKVLPLWGMLFEKVEERRLTPNYQMGRMGL